MLVAALIVLGYLLGFAPEIGAFFGLPIEVRHVTLSSGTLADAALACLTMAVGTVADSSTPGAEPAEPGPPDRPCPAGGLREQLLKLIDHQHARTAAAQVQGASGVLCGRALVQAEDAGLPVGPRTRTSCANAVWWCAKTALQTGHLSVTAEFVGQTGVATRLWGPEQP